VRSRSGFRWGRRCSSAEDRAAEPPGRGSGGAGIRTQVHGFGDRARGPLAYTPWGYMETNGYGDRRIAQENSPELLSGLPRAHKPPVNPDGPSQVVLRVLNSSRYLADGALCASDER